MRLKAKVIILTGAVLSVLTVSVPAFAASPVVGTITPASGTSNPNVTVSFTTTYTDPDGWQNIQYVYLLVNTSTSGGSCFYGYYNQNTNKLYLRNDAGNSWLGGYAPGSSNVIENSYAKLNCAGTTFSGTDTTLTVSWSITFKSPFTGAKNTYLYVKDDTNAYNGWVKKGTWTITNQAPSLGTVTPSSGISNPGETVSFTTTYSDPDGWLNIQYVYFLINTSVNGAYCFYGYYNQNTNKLYLRNDSNASWLGGYIPGASNVIENTYVKLNCAGTTVSTSGTTLTINWSITFKPAFTGQKNTYLYIIDDANVIANWAQKGTWKITNQTPSAWTINPASGSSGPDMAVIFTTTYIDPDIWQNIREAYFTINTISGIIGGVTTYYNRNSNKLYLRNNTNNGWLGGYIPGASNIIESSYMKLNCAGTTVTGSGTTLTINWSITFKSTFVGTKNTYLYVVDNASTNSGWVKVGTWTIDTTPPAGSIAIDNNATYTNITQVTLTLSATDPETGITQMQFSNDGTNWSTPESYNTTKAWTIPTGDGTKTVYVKYKNSAGLWSSAISDDIILDTTPPQNTSITIDQGEYTLTPNITLTLNAEDVSPIQMIISENQDFSGASWEIYSTTKSFTLSNSEGFKTIYAKFRDSVGNESVQVSATIYLNLYNEMYPVYSPNGERIVYVCDRQGNWDIWVRNTSGYGQHTQITVDTVEDTQPTWSSDGTKIAFVTTVDTAKGIWGRNSDGTGDIFQIQPGVKTGGSGGPKPEEKIYPDWSPKGDSVVMMWKVGSYPSDPFELAIGKTDVIYPKKLGVQNCIWPSFSPDGKEIVYAIQTGQYSWDIYKKIIDGDNNGEPDNLGEITQLTVNGYNNNYPRYSPDGNKIVYSTTEGGAPNIFVMDKDGFNPIQITQNENPTIDYGHPCFSPDGTKIVYHTNRYGKYDIFIRDYKADQTAYPSVQITQPLSFTEIEDNVDIIGTANDNISIDGQTILSALHHYILEYGQGYEPAEWQTITNSTQKKQNELLDILNITGLQDGIYTIRLRAVDEEGDEGVAKVYIKIKQVLPPQNPAITIPQYTNTRNITLTLSAEGATEMIISEDPNFADSQWEPYATTKQFTLSEGDGQKTIYVKYRNQKGKETQPVSASIVLDTILPQLTITTPLNNSYTNQAQINISGTFIEINLAAITVNGIQASIQDSTFTVQNIQLQSEGANTITIIITDLANNQNTYQITIIRDITPPQIEIIIPFDGYLTNQKTTAVTGTYIEENLDKIKVNTIDAVILENNKFTAMDIPLFEGINIITATITDLAGNTAQDTVTIIRDTIPPQNPSISIQQGDYTNNPNIILTLSCQDADQMVISEAPQFPNPQWGVYVNTKAFSLSSGDGQKTVYVKFRDLAGNETQPASDSIILDTTLPQIQITSPENNSVTSEAYVNVSGNFIEINIKTITINGVSAGIQGNIFTVQNLPLAQEGNNTITAVAIDLAGNTVQDMITVVFNPTPLDIDITLPENNFTTNQDSIKVLGTITKDSASVTVNGINALVGNGQFVVDKLPLKKGSNIIDAIATDSSGNSSADSVTVHLTSGFPAEVLVDDFSDSKKDSNNLGYSTGDNQTCSENLDMSEYHKLSWNKNTAYWYTGLWDSNTAPEGTDISPYERLTFKIKGNSGGENFSVELEDIPHGPDYDKRVEISNYIDISTQWQEVTIPIKDFTEQGVWKTHARGIVFNFDKTAAGAIYIDDIKFKSCTIDNFADEDSTKNSLGYSTGDDGTLVKNINVNGYRTLQWDNTSDYWWTLLYDNLYEFNANGFRYLYIGLRGENDGENFTVELQDNQVSSSVEIKNYITISKAWDYVYIPLSDFSVNKSRLRKLTLKFNKISAGTVYIDKIGITNRNGKGILKPQSTGPVKIIGTQLTVNDSPFQIRGVGYQPTPIGTDFRTKALFEDPGIYNRDLPNLRNMGCNTIRLWKKVNSKAFLDACYNNGKEPIYVILGYYIDPNSDLSNSTVRNLIKNDFQGYVMTYYKHPAVLLWALGNEMNMVYKGDIKDWYSLANELAKVAYELEGANYHPVAITNMDLQYVGKQTKYASDTELTYIDIWGVNAYRGLSYKGFFECYTQLSAKPLWIAEYGADAWHTNNPAMPQDGYEDAVTQAKYYVNNWKEIKSATRCLGGALMEYCDEWWKTVGGDWSTQDYKGFKNRYDQSDNYSNEEFWGLFKIQDNGNNPDIVIPRTGYEMMKMAFHNEEYPFVGLAWEFNTDGNAEGWNSVQSLSNFSVSNGTLLTTVTGSNPYMISPAGLTVNTLIYNTLEIRYRVAKGQHAKLVWKRNVDIDFTQDNIQEFSIFGDNKFHTYNVFLGNNKNWNETITQIGLIPSTGTSGVIEIDYIRLTQGSVPQDVTPPEDVTDLNAISGDTVVELSWAPSKNGEGDLTDQILYIDDGSGYDAGTSLGASVSQFAVTNLTNNTKYTFKITVKDEVPNESSGITVQCIPKDVIAPEDITNLAAAVGNGYVDLTWAASANTKGDLVDQILYIDSGTGYGSGISLGADKTSHKVNNLSNGILYTFKITVIDEVPNESKGVVVQAMPVDPSAKIVITSPSNNGYIGNSSVNVSGTFNGSNITIVVNGISASISGNTFIANNVPLTEGKNTIKATAASGGVVVGEYSICVIRDSFSPLIEILDPKDGEEVSGKL